MLIVQKKIPEGKMLGEILVGEKSYFFAKLDIENKSYNHRKYFFSMNKYDFMQI